MKSMKTLGLAALAALMAVALFAAAPAMAEDTTLCKSDEGTGAHVVCPENLQIEEIHEVTLAGAPMILLNGLGNVLCNELFKGLVPLVDVPITLDSPLIFFGKYTYTGCVRHKLFGGVENCTVEEKSEIAKIELLKEDKETASVKGKWEVQVTCGQAINCKYDAEGLIGTALGALLSPEENGGLSINGQVLHVVAGALCPNKTSLDLSTQWLVKTWIEE